MIVCVCGWYGVGVCLQCSGGVLAVCVLVVCDHICMCVCLLCVWLCLVHVFGMFLALACFGCCLVCALSMVGVCLLCIFLCAGCG